MYDIDLDLDLDLARAAAFPWTSIFLIFSSSLLQAWDICQCICPEQSRTAGLMSVEQVGSWGRASIEVATDDLVDDGIHRAGRGSGC